MTKAVTTSRRPGGRPKGRPATSQRPIPSHARALRALREKAGLSIADLSERVYGSRTATGISRLERRGATEMAAGTMFMLSAALGITVDQFKAEIARQKEIHHE